MVKDKLNYLLTMRYWFDIQPAITSTTSKVLLGLGIAFVVVSVVAKYKASHTVIPAEKKLWERFIAPGITMGLLLIVWVGARFQQGNIIGSHFVGWCLVLIAVAWFVPAIKYFIKEYGKSVDAWQKEQDKLKYINMK